MYIEFVVSYFLIGFLAILLAIVIVLQCIILKKLSRRRPQQQEISYSPYTQRSVSGMGGEVVVCRKCASQFASTHRVCPKCGTLR